MCCCILLQRGQPTKDITLSFLWAQDCPARSSLATKTERETKKNGENKARERESFIVMASIEKRRRDHQRRESRRTGDHFPTAAIQGSSSANGKKIERIKNRKENNKRSKE
jgi:hypothetical protein